MTVGLLIEGERVTQTGNIPVKDQLAKQYNITVVQDRMDVDYMQ